jgi:hypothetical protein
MNKYLIREKQAEFVEKVLPGKKVLEKELGKKREAFIKLFPKDSLKELNLNNYVIGGKRTKSFCYLIERTLKDLGSIRGATAFKFGIYFGRTKSDSNQNFRWSPKKWGDTESVAFEAIKEAIIDLINAGKNEDLAALKSNKLSPMFKGKILATYYPERYLSIFSNEFLTHLISTFNLSYEDISKLDPIEKRFLLLKELKNKDKVMKEWSVFEFSSFLWTYFPQTVVNETVKIAVELEPFAEVKFPEFFEVKPEMQNVEIIPTTEINKTEIHLRSNYKPDYETTNRNKRIQGEKAELWVLKYERDYLISKGKTELAGKVNRVSETDDSLGYDILSFDEMGKEKYIEVKSTIGKLGDNISFLITSNELIKAKELQNYWIFYVSEVKTTIPKITPLSIIDNDNKIKKTPTQYRMEMGIIKV